LFELNHLAFGTESIEEADKRLRDLGFRTVRGVCRWPMPAATYSAPSLSVMFADTYLDVIGFAGAGRGISGTGVVLGTDDFDAALVELEDFRPRPYEIERTLESGDRILYRIASLKIATRIPVLVIHDGDPQVMRTPKALAHPNGARGLMRVRLAAARDLERLTRAVELGTETGAALEFELTPRGPRYPW